MPARLLSRGVGLVCGVATGLVLLFGPSACHKAAPTDISPFLNLQINCHPTGANVSCTATFFGPVQDVTAVAEWLVSNVTVGQFTSPGLFVPRRAGKVELWALWNGYQSNKYTYVVGPGTVPRELAFLSGSVTDSTPTGARIVGATVQILDGFATGSQATTNENGAYTIHGILPNEVIHVMASRSGYAPLTETFVPDNGLPVLNFALQPAN